MEYKLKSLERRQADETVLPFIDGGSTRSGSEATFDVIDPSTGRRRLSIPAGCDADADRAVTAARAAFADGRWSDLPPSVKKGILLKFAELIAAGAAELDALDAGEMGKPIREVYCNAAAAAGLVRFYAEAIDKIAGDVFSSDKTSFVTQRRTPRGVVAAVVPWNFPTFNFVLKVAPALAAGNCVVLKPSEFSSRSALRLARFATEAGLPAGVLNVVPGIGETIGRALGLHPQVDMLTFTGSTVVGKRMLQYSGQSNMKVVMAECGGKSPHVVFDDGVDLDAASQAIAGHLLVNQGQLCSVGSRVLVQRSIHDQMIEKIAARITGTAIGNALDPNTTFGPLASEKQLSRVMQYIDGAKQERARLVTGGRKILQESGGFFIEPTLFSHVAPKSKLAQEEVFGPVLAVIPFDDEMEAINLANDTVYGLAAFVWTANLATGMRVGKGIRSSVLINAAAPAGEGAGHALSSEPLGQSGIGAESGMAGLESYLRRQLLWFNHG
jgi:acyl-CoA reductase-like NAD-dependent aldehyde dehydrogenase